MSAWDALAYETAGYWGKDEGEPGTTVRAIRNGDVGTSGTLSPLAGVSRTFTEKEIIKSQIHAGDTLLTTSGNYGRVSYVNQEPYNITCATNFVRLLRVNSSQVTPRYFYYALSHPAFAAISKSLARGATIKNLSAQSALKAYSFPIPPLPKQHHIAAVLDEADAICTKRRTQLAYLDDLPQALFHRMFGDPIAGTEGERQSIGHVAQILTGNTPSRSVQENFGPGIEWVKTNNLGGTYVEPATEHLTELGQQKARIAPAGSVLVSCIAGSRSSIGKASIARREVAFNQQINAVLPSPDLDSLFLLSQLQAAPELVRRVSTGGMKGLVSKSAFESISVLVPPRALQQEFATTVAAIHTERDRVARALAADEELFAALQYRAFRGEL